MKKLLPAFIIAIVSGFMLFIYEPIFLYATNVNDFWFDMYLIIKPLLTVFLLYEIILITFYVLTYLISSKLLKKDVIYHIIIILSFIVLMIIYVQGNYLISNLPPLDGTSIDWGAYSTEGIYSIVLIAVCTIVTIVLACIFKYEKIAKPITFISLTILVMLLSSFASVLGKEGVLKEKNVAEIPTFDNFSLASSNKNFFIFLFDAVDSTRFNEIMEASEYTDSFNDFTYYHDTVSGYPYTRDSIPLILTGKWNENKTTFNEYYNDAFNNSPLFKKLKSKNYQINLFEDEYFWEHDGEYDVANTAKLNKIMDKTSYIKQILKYDAFKYLPFQLKKYSKIETMDFNICHIVPENIEKFDWNNLDTYTKLKNDPIEKMDKNYFSFTHIKGAHVPYDYDENVNLLVDNSGTYDQQISATLLIINTFINRLKEYDVYDNSVIILMADHGFDYYGSVGRHNPMLYIKGIHEHHDNMIKSDKPVSYADLIDMYSDLLDDKQSTDLLPNIDYKRKRRYLWYLYTAEDHKVEYYFDGPAYERETMHETGVEYNR